MQVSLMLAGKAGAPFIMWQSCVDIRWSCILNGSLV